MRNPRFILLAAFVALVALPTSAQIQIILRESFIDSVKHRVTIDQEFDVVKAHSSPNSPSKDGDMHVAGWGSTIGLPVVAEIMNARDERPAVDVIHANEGRSTPVPMSGAWRIWCEHSGEQTQRQGGNHPAITNTNPDHVFEIHPVTRLNGIDLMGSLKPINGYRYKDAADAFSKYSNVRCKLEDQGDHIQIGTAGVGYNYVDFMIEIADDEQKVVEDGRFVFCKVMDLQGELLVQKMRMAFPGGSAAEREAATLQRGARMHVLGIPRVSLALVDYRLENSATNPAMLEWNLPVEMIIVATFGSAPIAPPVDPTITPVDPSITVVTPPVVTPPVTTPPTPPSNMTRTPDEWLTLLLLGALLGMAGQGIRVIVGIKKLNDANAQPNAVEEKVRLVQLALSFFIAFAVGAIAGILAAVSMDDTAVDGKIITAFIAAGYAGTDFIEGWMKRAPGNTLNGPPARLSDTGSGVGR